MCGTSIGCVRHGSQHFPPVTHTVIFNVGPLIFSWLQGPCSWPWCSAESVYQTNHPWNLPASPTWILHSWGLLFVSAAPITIPDTRWAFERASLNCWTESSAARCLGPSRPCGRSWQVGTAGGVRAGVGLRWGGVGWGEGKTQWTCFTKPCLWLFRGQEWRQRWNLESGGPSPSWPRAHAASMPGTGLPSGALLWLWGQALGFW